MQPLSVTSANPSQVNTSFSTMISLTILDSQGNEIPVRTEDQQPIQFIIPRDPNFIVPPMTLYNVSFIIDAKQPFYFHFINITQENENLTVSLHFEIRPNISSLNYLLIMKFDKQPILNSKIEDIDDWSLLCYSSKHFS